MQYMEPRTLVAQCIKRSTDMQSSKHGIREFFRMVEWRGGTGIHAIIGEVVGWQWLLNDKVSGTGPENLCHPASLNTALELKATWLAMVGGMN